MERSEDQAETQVQEERLKAILESLLFAAGEPVTLTQLANALESVPREQIRRALAEMATAYSSGGGGLVLEEVAGGYQLRTPREHALYVRRLLAAKPPRLSRPLLETLAIVAYRQPVTRAEIEQLRGVDTGGVLDTLTERGLIKIAGRKDAPGRPIIYASTQEFLELFGLKDLESLPDLEEFRELEALREPPAAGEQPPTVEAIESPPSELAQPESPESAPVDPAADSPSEQTAQLATEPAQPPEDDKAQG
jgi:segregation and condensation protein B